VGGVFDGATSVEQVGPGSWEVSFDRGWTIGDAVHGGCAQSAIVRAVLAESDHPHPVATSAHFLSPTTPGKARVSVDVLRSGRTASTSRAVLVQDGVEKVVALVTAGKLDAETPRYQVDRPGAPPPEECIARSSSMPDGSPVRFLEAIDVRLDPRHVGGPHEALSGLPEVRGWVRSRDGADPDPVFLTFCVDALPPTVLEIGGQGWSPTVQLSTYVRGLPAKGWLQVVARARSVIGGWFDEEAQVWDSAGRLVAQAQQLGRFRLRSANG
jgi:acyl-CoA thioesterase